MCVAGHEIVQFVSLVTALLDRPALGEQRYHCNLGEMTLDEPSCEDGCIYKARAASGESQFPAWVMTGIHPKAAESRRRTQEIEPGPGLPAPELSGLANRIKRLLGFG